MKHKKEIYGFLFSLALGIAFLYVAFRGVSFSEFIASLSRVSIWWMVIYIISTVFAHFIRAVRWKYLLKYIKKDVSFHHAFASVMIGYGFNNIIPRMGEVSRAVFLGQYEKISRISVLGSIVVERLIDMIMFMLAVLISGFIYSSNFSQTFSWLRLTFLIGIFGVLGLIVFLIVLIKKEDQLLPLIQRLLSRYSAETAVKVQSFLGKLVSGFKCFQTFGDVTTAMVLSVGIMINYAISSWLGFQMLGMLRCDAGMAWVTMSISAIGVMVPTPGGLGSYHTITRSILQRLYFFDENISFSYAFLCHGLTYFAVTIIAVIYLFAFRQRFGKIDLGAIFRNEKEQTQ